MLQGEFMRSKSSRIFLYTLFYLFIAFLIAVGIYDFANRDKELYSDGLCVSAFAKCDTDERALDASVEKFISLKRAEKNTENITLCPGGYAFGVKMLTDGVVLSGTTELSCDGKAHSPAYDGGLRAGDVIIKIDGQMVKSVHDVTNAIERSCGRKMVFVCRRAGKEHTFELQPEYCTQSGKYKLGIWIRDNTAGIGTVTYINPQTGEFGGLGHGIYDTDTGELLPLNRGIVTDVNVTGIIKGECGKPGEIKGYLKNEKRGALLKNDDCGIFGIFAPYEQYAQSGALSVAHRSEVKEGKAKIRCTLDAGGVNEYEVEIINIKYDSTGTKCFTVKVTDERLIEKTGGIVQGMSGSPIIQNGKLVGAVTHVMINDPTTGYGIFIENMLSSQEKASIAHAA